MTRTCRLIFVENVGLDLVRTLHGAPAFLHLRMVRSISGSATLSWAGRLVHEAGILWMSGPLRFTSSCAASCQQAARRFSPTIVHRIVCSRVRQVRHRYARLGLCQFGRFDRCLYWLTGTGSLEEDEKLSAHVEVMAFSYSHTTLRAVTADHPGPVVADFGEVRVTGTRGCRCEPANCHHGVETSSRFLF